MLALRRHAREKSTLPVLRASLRRLWSSIAARVVLGCLLGSTAAPARVATAQCVELAADLPEDLRGCVSAERLCASYQRALAASGGGSQASEPRWQVQLRAAKAGSAAVRSLELEAFSAGRSFGQRTLEVRSRDCAALPDALALVLVLLAQEAGPGAVEPQLTAAEPAAQQEREPIPAPAPRAHGATSAGSLAVGVGAGVSFGVLPSAAFGLSLQASTLSEPVAFRVRASFLWPQELAVAEGRVLMRDYELALEACPGAQLDSRPRIALRLCVGPRLGLFHARGRDFDVQNERATEFLMYLGVTPEASLALAEGTWLQLSAGVAFALVRPRMGVAFDGGRRWRELSAPDWLRAELALSLVQIF